MKIGPYNIFTVESGYAWLDGGAMFGVIPKVLWNKTNPADEMNRIQLALRTMVIRDDSIPLQYAVIPDKSLYQLCPLHAKVIPGFRGTQSTSHC